MKAFSSPRRAALLACALLALASGCGKKESGDASTGAVVARVNDRAIRESDVQQELRQISSLMGPAGAQAANSPEALAGLRRQSIDNLIEKHLLLGAATTEGLAPNAAEVDSEFVRVKSQYPDAASFEAKLRELSMSEAEIRQEILFGMAVRRLGAKHQATMPVTTAEDARAFYDANPQQFAAPEEIRASHILLHVPESAPDTARADARKRAQAILAEVNGGRPFADVAREKSDDPGSKEGGGDLGYFSRGRMVPAFENAAFALPVGEVSAVIESPFGFHIIKVTDRRDARTLPFEEVRDRLIAHLEQSKGERAIQAALEEARKTAKIEKMAEANAG